MSKMPAKKKSCFQITSVTTAQAATSITDDTESLDDPDESRTEDVSSEIFDTSRATDYGPEEVCERSSSEETLNNVGDAETPGTVTPNVMYDAQFPAGIVPINGGSSTPWNVVLTSSGVLSNVALTVQPTSQGPSTVGLNLQQPAPLAGVVNAAAVTSQPTVPAVTCSSRFRVIKLDHSTGEPFRRGRWTCLDYYDKDLDSTVVRTVDSIRHNVAATLDNVAERDSGIGITGGSLAPTPHSIHGSESSDPSLIASSQLHQTDVNQGSHQHFLIGHQPISGTAGVSQPVYSSAMGNQQFVLQQQAQSQVTVQSGLNGKGMQPQNVTVLHPGMPLVQGQHPSIPVTQPQQFAYTHSQITPGHILPNQLHVPTGQAEYVQHMPVPQSQGTVLQTSTGPVHNPAMSSLPVDQVIVQGPSTAAICQQAGLQQHVNVMQGLGPGVLQQQTVAQHQIPNAPIVGSGIPSSCPSVAPGVQNVPVIAPSTGVASVSSSMSTPLPSVPASLVLPQQSGQQSIRSTGIVPTVGLPVMQVPANPPSMQQSTMNQYATQAVPGIGLIDDSRKLDPLPPQPSVTTEGKLLTKPVIPDTFINPVHLPATTPMNTLANSVLSGISIDGDEDRNPSAAFFRAFRYKLRDSKTLSNDLVKSHLMYAVREEVEVLKEQIKELLEKNSMLERENALLKSLSNSEQIAQLPTQQAITSSTAQQQTTVMTQVSQSVQPPQQPNVSSA
ncbi:TSC22 domain family protein 2 [Protopterus annectens]|uniref:TSC22 domain family protein 2 n=1 Tax=Protopterus annectens TaxID=7888 RepID=UPI001CF93A99|nr:TSC22 domain family protein 2 [Protopterus annectens]